MLAAVLILTKRFSAWAAETVCKAARQPQAGSIGPPTHSRPRHRLSGSDHNWTTTGCAHKLYELCRTATTGKHKHMIDKQGNQVMVAQKHSLFGFGYDLLDGYGNPMGHIKQHDVSPTTRSMRLPKKPACWQGETPASGFDGFPGQLLV